MVFTGGAQGISMKLMEERCTVLVIDIDEEAGRDFVKGNGKVFNIEFGPVDISDRNSVEKLMQDITDGHGRLDGLVNNAAIADPYNKPVGELDLSEWDQKINTNLTGAMACVKYAKPLLGISGGSIVNVASIRGSTTKLMLLPKVVSSL